jgi:hypothetical protein
MKKIKFDKLLQESKKLTAHIDNQGFFTIQRSIAQIEEASRQLAAKASVIKDDRAKTKAYFISKIQTNNTNFAFGSLFLPVHFT